MSHIESYPLSWPEGWARTQINRRQRSQFKTSFNSALQGLLSEIRRLGGRNVILSTDIELRRDGLPYASRRDPEDVGVAVYFEWNGRPMCFACDKWDRVKDNIHSISKTIGALRGIERWGASDMVERAFTGFAALPDGSKQTWRDVLDYHGNDLTKVKCNYRRLAKKHHPDNGGDAAEFNRIQEAYEEAQRELMGAQL